MGSKSDYLEKKVLDHVLRVAAYTQPTGLLVGLYTVAPSDTGGGTEVTGGSYARQTITFSAATLGAGSTSNSSQINFPTATASWGTVVAFGVFDSAGTLLYWSNLDTNKTISSGDTATFLVGSLVITED